MSSRSHSRGHIETGEDLSLHRISCAVRVGSNDRIRVFACGHVHIGERHLVAGSKSIGGSESLHGPVAAEHLDFRKIRESITEQIDCRSLEGNVNFGGFGTGNDLYFRGEAGSRHRHALLESHIVDIKEVLAFLGYGVETDIPVAVLGNIEYDLAFHIFQVGSKDIGAFEQRLVHLLGRIAVTHSDLECFGIIAAACPYVEFESIAHSGLEFETGSDEPVIAGEKRMIFITGALLLGIPIPISFGRTLGIRIVVALNEGEIIVESVESLLVGECGGSTGLHGGRSSRGALHIAVVTGYLVGVAAQELRRQIVGILCAGSLFGEHLIVGLTRNLVIDKIRVHRAAMLTFGGLCPGEMNGICSRFLGFEICHGGRTVGTYIEVERGEFRSSAGGMSGHNLEIMHALRKGVGTRNGSAGSHGDGEVEGFVEISAYGDIAREGSVVLSGGGSVEGDRTFERAAREVRLQIADGVQQSLVVGARDEKGGEHLAVGIVGDQACGAGVDIDFIETGEFCGAFGGAPVEFACLEVKAGGTVIDRIYAGVAHGGHSGIHLVDAAEFAIGIADAPELAEVIAGNCRHAGDGSYFCGIARRDVICGKNIGAAGVVGGVERDTIDFITDRIVGHISRDSAVGVGTEGMTLDIFGVGEIHLDEVEIAEIAGHILVI